MKLFGKKTLALLLALSMAMSVCVFADEPVTVAATGVTISGNHSLYFGGSLELTATVEPENATNKNVTWSSSDPSIATVSETGKVTAKSKAGTVTITAVALGGESVSAKVDITVNVDTVKTVDKIGPVEVAYGTSASDAAATLAKAEAEVTYENGGKGTAKIEGWQAPGTYDGTKPGNYTFTCTAPAATATVTVKKASLKSSVTVGVEAMPTGDADDLDDILENYEEIDLAFNELSEKVEFTIGKSDNDDFEWWACESFDEDEADTYTFVAKAKTHDLYDLKDLKLTVVVYSEDYEMEVERGGSSLSALATQLDTVLNALYGEGLELFVITDLDLDGGNLYTDSTCAAELDEDELTKAELSDVYYVPNGSGDESVIEFEAYYDEDEDEEILEGSLTLVADPYMMVSIEVSKDDVITLDADEFEEQFLNQDEDYEELSYVTFSHSNGKSKGYLYYDYDAEDEKGTAVKSAKCYVKSEDDDDINLSDVVYVPGSSMKAGTYTITFTAKGYKDGSSSLKTETGYLVITFIEKADITVNAGKGETVKIDPDWFVDFLEDEKDTDEIAYVVISGAPRSKTAGYLVTDDDQLTKSGDKAFYADEDDVDVDKKKYDLYDLYFEGGTKASTTNATFKIYYLKSNGKVNSSPVQGTIDFVVGSSQSLNGTLRASEVMTFNDTTTLNAFEDLGENDNVYVEFTSLPVGGKLYYNYGTSSQEDVTIGTDYYIRTASGKKQLKNVTFVPSYSSSKVQKTISMNIKAYNSKNKAVNGTINIAVTYAASSAYFYDVNTSTYADSVDFLKNRNITTGMTTTSFGLTSNVTRGQFVTFLYRAAGQPAVYGVNNFKDVKTSDYYYNAVRWAVQEGITTGRSSTVFDPNANVTHQELLTFLYRYDVEYLGHSGATGSASYIYDYNKVDAYAQTPVRWAVYKGIIESGNLNPTTAGSRGTVALWLHRMLTL